MILDELYNFFEQDYEYGHIFLDTNYIEKLDEGQEPRNSISIHLYDHRIPEPFYGLSTSYVRFVVWRNGANEAMETALGLLRQLNEAADEEGFISFRQNRWNGVPDYRMRMLTGPTKLRDDGLRAAYKFEVAFTGVL